MVEVSTQLKLAIVNDGKQSITLNCYAWNVQQLFAFIFPHLAGTSYCLRVFFEYPVETSAFPMPSLDESFHLPSTSVLFNCSLGSFLHLQRGLNTRFQACWTSDLLLSNAPQLPAPSVGSLCSLASFIKLLILLPQLFNHCWYYRHVPPPEATLLLPFQILLGF